jgi:tetratricopeptide (TPR) repeat protein
MDLSMKKKCPLCGNGKAKRLCMLRNNEAICSLCCVELRGDPCDGCSHYTEAMRYRAERKTTDEPPEGHFTILIDPELEDAVESALSVAEQGNLDEALSTLQQLEQNNRPDYNVCFGLGTVYGLKGNPNEAVRWLKKSIQIFPYSAETYCNLGAAYQELFDIGNMAKAFRKVILYGDASEEYYRKVEDKLADITKVIRESYGIDLDAFLKSQDEFDHAFVLLETGEYEQALAGFRRAAAINENNASTHGNMGLTLAFLGKKAEALSELDRALEIDPGYEPAITNRAFIERMNEGEPITGGEFRTINSARERASNRKNQ